MAKNNVADDAFINSIIGEGTRFKGELEINGLLRIDGDFSGSVKTSGKVLVGKNGRADCTIHAATVVVGGMVRGDIYTTKKVIVLSSAMVIGNIYSPKLIAEEGVVLDGNLQINPMVTEEYELDNMEEAAKKPLGNSFYDTYDEKSSYEENPSYQDNPLSEEGTTFESSSYEEEHPSNGGNSQKSYPTKNKTTKKQK